MALPYDSVRNPSAPVLTVRIGAPGQSPTEVVSALIDTGADRTIIAEELAEALGLPAVDEVPVEPVGVDEIDAFVYIVDMEALGVRFANISVVGFGDETLIGRDLLNTWTVILRGREELMEIEL